MLIKDFLQHEESYKSIFCPSSVKCICFTNQNQNIQNTIMVLNTVMVQKLMAQEF